MRILLTKDFAKLATRHGLTQKSLRHAIREIELGLGGNSLGGNLIKKRIAVGNKGKSSGLRIILAYQTTNENIFCLYLLAKSQRDNIDTRELAALRQLGQIYLALTNDLIQNALRRKILLEIKNHDDNEENNL